MKKKKRKGERVEKQDERRWENGSSAERREGIGNLKPLSVRPRSVAQCCCQGLSTQACLLTSTHAYGNALFAWCETTCASDATYSLASADGAQCTCTYVLRM